METVIHTPSLETRLIILSEKMTFLSDAFSALASLGTPNSPCETMMNVGALEGCSHICGDISDELEACMDIASDLGKKVARQTA